MHRILNPDSEHVQIGHGHAHGTEDAALVRHLLPFDATVLAGRFPGAAGGANGILPIVASTTAGRSGAPFVPRGVSRSSGGSWRPCAIG